MINKKQKNPNFALIAVTYNCNARCKMCNIWQKKSENEVDPDIYLKLPKELKDVNITGGEPFLREDLMKIIDNVFARCNLDRLVISSNGFLTDRIVAFIKELSNKKYYSKVSISFSLDGIGEKHSEIRGIPNAFEKVSLTILELKKIGFKSIGIGYTFTSANEDEYKKVYEFCEKNDLNFGSTIAHNAENYFSTQDNLKPNAKIVKEQTDYYIKDKIKSFKKNELGKCYYTHGLVHYAATGKALVPCDAMRGSFFLDPKGNIYPCNILSDIAGNLIEDDFDKIWQGDMANKIRIKTANCPHPCWMVCTAKPGIKKHWFKTGMWILKEKIKVLVS